MTNDNSSPAVRDLSEFTRRPTVTENFYVDWGLETLKGMASSYDDRFQKLITLNAALIAGASVWVKEDIAPTEWRSAFIICACASLILALLGIYPRGGAVNLNAPNEIRHAERFAIKMKGRCWWAATAALIVAFVAGLIGILVRQNFPISR